MKSVKIALQCFGLITVGIILGCLAGNSVWWMGKNFGFVGGAFTLAVWVSAAVGVLHSAGVKVVVPEEGGDNAD